MHPGNVKFGAQMEQFGAQVLGPNCACRSSLLATWKIGARTAEFGAQIAWQQKKIKRLFHGPVMFQFLRDAFQYKYKPCIRWLCV